jgi:hypothetical protein
MLIRKFVSASRLPAPNGKHGRLSRPDSGLRYAYGPDAHRSFISVCRMAFRGDFRLIPKLVSMQVCRRQVVRHLDICKSTYTDVATPSVETPSVGLAASRRMMSGNVRLICNSLLASEQESKDSALSCQHRVVCRKLG